MSDDVLDFAGVLGGGIDDHVAVFAGNGERDLPFQIEMFLPADPEFAGDVARRRRDLLGGVAANEGVVRENGRARDAGIVDVDDGHGGSCRDLRQSGAAPRLIAGFRQHDEQHLAVEHHPVRGDRRIVADTLGTDVVHAGYIGGGQDLHDAGGFLDSLEIELGDAADGDRRIARRRMEGADRRPHVVHVDGLAGHVLGAAVMRIWLVHDRGRRAALDDVGEVHVRPPPDAR